MIKLHIPVALAVVEDLAERGGAIMFVSGHAWIYGRGQWKFYPVKDWANWFKVRAQAFCDTREFEASRNLILEAQAHVERMPSLNRDHVDWDLHEGKIATRSGLVDIVTRTATDLAPEHWCTKVIQCDYDPDARCPWWLTALADTFSKQAEDGTWQRRRDAEDLLQEMFGSFLSPERPLDMRRALVLLGASHTGKSSLLKVVAKFFGPGVNATKLESVEGNHGTMAFMKPDPWILHEAFRPNHWEVSMTVKAILSADDVPVNLKFGELLSHVFKHPVAWGTNHPPQFKEDTKAMQNRLVMIKCEREFHDEEPVGAAVEARRLGYNSLAEFFMAEEMPGILNWAIEGYKRLAARGRFDLPEETKALLQEMRDDSSIVAGFIRDCCEFDPDTMVANPDFMAAWTSWFREERSRDTHKTPAIDAVKSALKNLNDRRIDPTYKTGSGRYVAGIKLNEQGLAHWSAYSTSREAQDGAVRLSHPDEVNKTRGQPRRRSGRPSLVRP